MGLKELALGLEGDTNGLAVVNVTLSTVDYWNVAQTKGNDTSGKNINDISALVPV